VSEILKAGSHTYGHWRTLVQAAAFLRGAPSLRAEAIHERGAPDDHGLLRRFAPRKDGRGRTSVRLAFLAILTLAFAAPASARTLKLVALGDSLTAGYGVPAGEAFPDQLEAALKAKGFDVAVVNAGVSGDTADDGLARYDWAVPPDADALIVELGANDMLRGLAPERTKTTLATILDRAKAAHLPTLLAGMRAAPNLGAEYDRAFDAIYPALAQQDGAILYPFFLDGVAGDPKLNQPDGLHPTAKGVAVIVRRILPSVEELLGRTGR
jgi:acyl-CoA thioesterase I